MAVVDVALALALLASVGVAIARTPGSVGESGGSFDVDTPAAIVTAERPADRPGTPFRQSPFRLGDGVSDLQQEGRAPTGGPPASPNPMFAVGVTAIVGGPPWRAVLTRLPGTAGSRVVRPGDRFASIEVRAIAKAHVVLVAPDTSWVIALPPRRP